MIDTALLSGTHITLTLRGSKHGVLHPGTSRCSTKAVKTDLFSPGMFAIFSLDLDLGLCSAESKGVPRPTLRKTGDPPSLANNPQLLRVSRASHSANTLPSSHLSFDSIASEASSELAVCTSVSACSISSTRATCVAKALRAASHVQCTLKCSMPPPPPKTYMITPSP